MKTTIEISDSLLREAKKYAAQEGTTLKALVERGLRRIVSETQPKKKKPFRMITFDGGGISPEFADWDWQKIRDAAYEDRGA